MITTTPKEQFEEQGYLTGIPVLTTNETSEFRNAFDELEARVGRGEAQVALTGKEREIEFVWRLATHPKVLDGIESVIGADIVLLSTHFFCKYPTPKTEGAPFVAWHQDVTYWGLEPPNVVSAWLAIDDSKIDNGCLRVIDGSHKLGILEHDKADGGGNLLSINQAIPADLFDMEKAVDVELEAGMMSIHEGMTIHGSNPNNSDRRRCGIAIVYMTPEVRIVFDPKFNTEWTPTVVRGEDRFNHNAYIPAAFPPE